VKRAIALRYDEEMHDAPLVVSTGEGDLADRIERAARDHGVEVVRDIPLAEALSELRVGEPIPEALYASIAAILGEIAGRAP
jgi:type III secretion system FlhB-like substrate exporter